MRAYAQKPKAAQKTPVEANKVPNSQMTIGNQAVQKQPQTNPDGVENSPNPAHATSRFGFDFSQIPLFSKTQLKQGTPSAEIRVQTEEHPASSAGALAAEGYAKRSDLHRHSSGPGPATAPAIVHEVLQDSGQPIPDDLRSNMEARLGHNFADVRLHTGERAGASAEAVAAHAYTVGRHIVFAPGRFDLESEQGQQLLSHELTHAAAHPAGQPTPSGQLRVSTPNEAVEQHAVNVARGVSTLSAIPPTPSSSGLFRQPAPFVALTGLRVNHDRVTVPPIAGLSFSATKAPARASSVTLSVEGDNAVIAAGTTVDNTTGAITVAAGQTGGSANARADQAQPGGGSSFITAPFNFTAIPAGISSTSATQTAPGGFYGGDFVHTFISPAGGQTALDRSHVNEQFVGGSGTTLVIQGSFGPLTITVNSPNSPAAGWDLDNSGAMTGPDHVTWQKTSDARPFVTNASHPAPASPLPQALLATQNFRNLSFPNRVYGAAAVATTTHRRAFEDRNNLIKAVTSANAAGINEEVVDDYDGPTIFRRCRANPASIPVSPAAPPRGAAPAAPASAVTSTIDVDAEGIAATPTFSVRPPALGCRISASGELTPGTTPGTVTVRAGNSTNFDETTVTLTPPPAAPAPTPTPTPAPAPRP